MTTNAKITYTHLARIILEGEKKPLSVEEIWDLAEQKGLASQLNTTGKTPKATLGARLYTDAKSKDGIFAKVGFRPAKFVLRSLVKTLPKAKLEQLAQTPPSPTKDFAYDERYLHPALVLFAKEWFDAHCKTISHEKSQKSGQKHNEWLHPDVAAFTLATQDWKGSVVEFAQSVGEVKVRLYSFELKLSLEFTTLRHWFFEAVSNSSWAHEGYLVAAKIDGDPNFRRELERLSQSFGIGVIELNTKDPRESEVLFPARVNPKLDWETINRIASVNEDFEHFIASVEKSVKINDISAKDFDPVLQGDGLDNYVNALAGNANPTTAASAS